MRYQVYGEDMETEEFTLLLDTDDVVAATFLTIESDWDGPTCAYEDGIKYTETF